METVVDIPNIVQGEKISLDRNQMKEIYKQNLETDIIKAIAEMKGLI